MHPRKHRLSTALVAAVVAMCWDAAHAERLWPVEQRVNLSLGAFMVDTDTRVRADGTANVRGTDINLDRTFGFGDQDRFRFDGYWRFAQRHKVRLMYFSSRSEESRTISEPIEFQGTTYPIDALVDARFNTDVLELAYEYAFLRRDSFEIAASLGLHNLKVSTRLRASASSTAGAGGLELSEEAKGNGPLPVLGLHGIWAFSDRLYLDAQAQFFGLKFDEYDGHLQDYKLTLVWMPIEHVGIGVGYNDFSTRLDVDADDFNGRLQFDYGGAIAFVTVAF